jgi:prolyl oligopeptidase
MSTRTAGATGCISWPWTRRARRPSLIDSFDGLSAYLGTIGESVYVLTNIAAPHGRIVAIDLARPEPAEWREVVAEGELPIEGASIVDDTLVVSYLEDVKSRIELFALDGASRGTLPLPGIGKVTGFPGDPSKEETFFRFESFDNPGTVFRFRPAESRVDEFHQAATALDTASLVTEQVFYESRDGTRVPMFLVYRKGLVRDGSNPTLLYGYGGFNLDAAAVGPAAARLAGHRRGAGGGQPARRRRVRGGVACGRHPRAQAERTSTISSPQPSG